MSHINPALSGRDLSLPVKRGSLRWLVSVSQWDYRDIDFQLTANKADKYLLSGDRVKNICYKHPDNLEEASKTTEHMNNIHSLCLLVYIPDIWKESSVLSLNLVLIDGTLCLDYV